MKRPVRDGEEGDRRDVEAADLSDEETHPKQPQGRWVPVVFSRGWLRVGKFIMLAFTVFIAATLIFTTPNQFRSCFGTETLTQIDPIDICLVTWAKFPSNYCERTTKVIETYQEQQDREMECNFWRLMLHSKYGTISNKEKYAMWHGHRFYNDNSTQHGVHDTPCFTVVKKYIDPEGEYKCKWVMWVDADALIMNPRKRLELLVDDRYDLLVPEMYFGSVNPGVFLAKGSTWATDFFDDLVKNNTDILAHGTFEQEAMNRFIYRRGGTQSQSSLDHVKLLRLCSLSSKYAYTPKLFSPAEWWWSFWGAYAPGDFIVHFFGKKTHRELAKVQEILQDD